MELTPHVPESNESDDDDDSSSRSKKKRAGALGAFIVEPKSEKQSAAEKKDAEASSTLEKLFSSEPKDKTESKEKPETETELAESTEVDETAAPLEALSEEEQRYTEEQIVATLESPVVEAEAGDEEAEADAAAAQAAVENFRAKIAEEHKSAEQAYQETVQELASETEPENEEPAADEPREFDEEPIALQPETTTKTNSEDDEDYSSQPATASTASTKAGGSGSGSSSGVGGGSPGGSWYGFGAGAPGGGSSASPSAVATPSRPNTAPVYDPNTAGEPAGSFLVGGILGYLIGRRRGRIKTERRLIPVQKKLEKQVEDLQADIIAKEDDIRKKALEKSFAERHGRKPAGEQLAESAPSGPVAAPEVSNMHPAQPNPESIGRVLVAAEAAPGRGRSSMEKAPETKPKPTERDVQTMDRDELLAISETIVVAESTLRQIFETHLLGEQGLRRLVGEHLQGKDIKRTLRQELIERQIDFERDPILRDKASTSDNSRKGAATKSFSQLLQSVNRESDQAETEKTAMLQTQAEQAAKRNAAQQQQRRIADTAMVTVIMALIALIAFLIFSRG